MITTEEEEKYKANCLEEWHKNSRFWAKTRRINDEISDFIVNFILNTKNQFQDKIKIIDIGCGEGWLLKELERSSLNMSFTGIDFNDSFINQMRQQHPKFNFLWYDYEKRIEKNEFKELDNHYVVSCLSLIEMLSLEIPFQNTKKLLKKGGYFIVITLNPYFEIMRLNKTYQSLEADFKKFRQNNAPKIYRKEILIEGKHSHHYYYGVLHTFEDFINQIIKNEFKIIEFKELNFLNGGIKEPIYHAYILKKI